MAARVGGDDAEALAQGRHKGIPDAAVGSRAVHQEESLALATVVPDIDPHTTRAFHADCLRIQ